MLILPRSQSLHRATKSGRRLRIAATAVAATLMASLVLAASWSAAPAAATTGALMGNAAPKNLVTHSDSSGVEVGTRFSAKVDGTATGMRFWKGKGAAGPHTGTLWSSAGTKLATAKFTAETGSGWQTATFDKVVSLTSGSTYVVSYFAPNGRYAATHNYTGKSQSQYLSLKSKSGVFAYGSASRFPTESFRKSNYWVDVVFTPGKIPGGNPVPPGSTPDPTPEPTPTPTPEPTPTPTPTPTPPPTPTPTPPPSTTPPGTTPTVPSPGFPSASTTGVPAGTVLTPYTGPCRITTPNTVIDAKQVNCELKIEVPGVVITRSSINGIVYTDEHGSGAFTITDSQVNAGNQEGTGIGDARFTATRVHVVGGNRSVNCFLDCTIQNSYVHGQFTDTTGRAHESGIRMGSNAVIRGNTIACDAPDVAPDAGCSAALTGYGDFAAVRNNTIDGNLFIGGSGGYCAYGGSTAGKPFSSGTRDIRFTNNVWQRGPTGNCGFWGPITSFDLKAPGNVWSNNTWTDGTPVRAAN